MWKQFQTAIIHSLRKNVSKTIDNTKSLLDISYNFQNNGINVGGWVDKAADILKHGRKVDYIKNAQGLAIDVFNFTINSTDFSFNLSIADQSSPPNRNSNIKLLSSINSSISLFGEYSEDLNYTSNYDPKIPNYIRYTSMVLCIFIMCLGFIGNVMVSIFVIPVFIWVW